MIQDLKRIIEQVSRDKGIERDVLIGTLEEAMRSAARKKFGHDLDLEVAYNDEFGEIEAFQFKEVVSEVTDSLLEISLDEGRELDPDCELGDSLGIKLDTDTFGRIAAQSAKQVIIQGNHPENEGCRAGDDLRGLQRPDWRDHQRHRSTPR
jgi:N utilization substance protein A